jgi:hypothetical protein
MGENRNTYEIFVRTFEENRPLLRLGVDERTIFK